VVAAYRASIGVPDRVRSGGKDYPFKGELTWGRQDDAPPCECRARKKRYDAAFLAVYEAGHWPPASSPASLFIASAARILCCRSFVGGLDPLVKHFGLGSQRKSVRAGNLK
jgi:pimeloyl-ACP methyl ester carboxylesterase